MFERNSRYRSVETYEVTDRRGRRVTAVAVPAPPNRRIRGDHRRTQGQRLDLLAAFYLRDSTAYWEIAEANDVMLPEALSEARIVSIPTR